MHRNGLITIRGDERQVPVAFKILSSTHGERRRESNQRARVFGFDRQRASARSDFTEIISASRYTTSAIISARWSRALTTFRAFFSTFVQAVPFRTLQWFTMRSRPVSFRSYYSMKFVVPCCAAIYSASRGETF